MRPAGQLSFRDGRGRLAGVVGPLQDEPHRLGIPDRDGQDGRRIAHVLYPHDAAGVFRVRSKELDELIPVFQGDGKDRVLSRHQPDDGVIAGIALAGGQHDRDTVFIFRSPAGGEKDHAQQDRGQDPPDTHCLNCLLFP